VIRIKPGDLVRCGGELVTVLAVNGEWCTVRAFGALPCERLTLTLRVPR
jgi:hypothetical protein